MGTGAFGFACGRRLCVGRRRSGRFVHVGLSRHGLSRWLRRLSRCRVGLVALDTGALALFGIGMLGEVELLGPEHLLAAQDDQQLIIGQPKHLVRGQHPPPADSLRVAVLGDDLRQGEALPCGHGGVDLHRHVPAAGAEVLRSHVIRGAQHDLGVGVAQQLRPQVIWVAVLQLGKALRAHDDLERSRPDGGQPPAEILDGADVVHLVQDDVDRHLTSLFRGAVGVAHELDEQEGEEQADRNSREEF